MQTLFLKSENEKALGAINELAKVLKIDQILIDTDVLINFTCSVEFKAKTPYLYSTFKSIRNIIVGFQIRMTN